MLLYDRRRYVGIMLSQMLIGEPIINNNNNHNNPAVTVPPLQLLDGLLVPEDDDNVRFPPMSSSSSSSTSSSSSATATTATATASMTMLEELAKFIVANTPRAYRAAIQKSGGKFLYRGNDEDDSDTITTDTDKTTPTTNRIGRIQNPDPDLLELATYGNDTAAVGYFQRLEQQLANTSNINHNTNNNTRFVAKPSNGHIATTDPKEANKWGNVVSVWPLLVASATTSTSDEQGGGTTTLSLFSYVWLQDRSTFYPSTTTTTTTTTATTTANNNNNINDNDDGNGNDNDHDVLIINERLDDALKLKSGREVLFATTTVTTTTEAAAGSSATTKKNNTPPLRRNNNKILSTALLPSSSLSAASAFLAVPIEFDDALRKQLELLRYGL